MSLVDALPTDPSADSIYAAFSAWVSDQGLVLYPHQEEAVIELFSDHNVVLGTTTGSGRSLVAVAAHFAALAEGRTIYYTAPIKALVSEEFFVRRTAAVGRRRLAVSSGEAVVCGGSSSGETRTRTGDTTIFSRVLYQLSYLAAWWSQEGIACTRGGEGLPLGACPAGSSRSSPPSQSWSSRSAACSCSGAVATRTA